MISPRFTVVWLPGVQDGLTRYWLASDSAERARITRLVRLIELALSMAPESQGEPDGEESTVRLGEIGDSPPPVRVASTFT